MTIPSEKSIRRIKKIHGALGELLDFVDNPVCFDDSFWEERAVLERRIKELEAQNEELLAMNRRLLKMEELEIGKTPNPNFFKEASHPDSCRCPKCDPDNPDNWKPGTYMNGE